MHSTRSKRRKVFVFRKAQSDFDFLSQLAKDNGWEMYIDHTQEPRGYVLKFQFLIQDYSPSIHLKWGESLIDFHPQDFYSRAGIWDFDKDLGAEHTNGICHRIVVGLRPGSIRSHGLSRSGKSRRNYGDWKVTEGGKRRRLSVRPAPRRLF